MDLKTQIKKIIKKHTNKKVVFEPEGIDAEEEFTQKVKVPILDTLFYFLTDELQPKRDFDHIIYCEGAIDGYELDLRKITKRVVNHLRCKKDILDEIPDVKTYKYEITNSQQIGEYARGYYMLELGTIYENEQYPFLITDYICDLRTGKYSKGWRQPRDESYERDLHAENQRRDV